MGYGKDVTGEEYKERHRKGQRKRQRERMMEGETGIKSIIGKWSTDIGHRWVIILENTWSGEKVKRREGRRVTWEWIRRAFALGNKHCQ